MSRYIILFFAIISLVSCDSKIDRPDPFLDHDGMVDLMTDMSLAEGTRIFARPNHLERKEGEYSINDYYTIVLEKYNLTQTQLDSINAWYINYPGEYQSIFKDVLDRLNKLQAKEKSEAKKENKELLEKRELIKDKMKAKKEDKKKGTPLK